MLIIKVVLVLPLGVLLLWLVVLELLHLRRVTRVLVISEWGWLLNR